MVTTRWIIQIEDSPHSLKPISNLGRGSWPPPHNPLISPPNEFVSSWALFWPYLLFPILLFHLTMAIVPDFYFTSLVLNFHESCPRRYLTILGETPQVNLTNPTNTKFGKCWLYLAVKFGWRGLYEAHKCFIDPFVIRILYTKNALAHFLVCLMH
jgi:hypothetical protein